VLTGEIASPEDLVFELKLLGLIFNVSQKNLNTLSVWNLFERSVNNLGQSFKEALFYSLIEKFEIIFVV